MRIQEMRSGVVHLPKKTDEIDIDEIFRRMQNEPASPGVSAAASELDSPHWSVVSSRQPEATGITFREAAVLVEDLALHGVRGLCVVSDEAAKRISR